ncbi:MAG: peptidylprolyl isomerase [Proteiniphilum sp.]|jgi:FKBP-type peptidyl-prolyl cis-trans isomerase SlyD|nr:peptidylprolyl isomerase [Proteiniphilum sp.]
MKISENKYVTLSYDLNVGEGEERELMEQATAEKPLEFIFGTNSMLEAFEKQIEGLGQGDTFSFQLTPEEAYGDYDESKIIELPKNIFEIDGKIDDQVLFEGNTVPMMDSSGNRLTGSVMSIAEDVVTMDFNHPLAGETMHFEGSVTAVREASAEEIAALFSGGGCGCGSGGCGSCGDGSDEGGCGSESGGCGSGCSC